MPVLFGLVDPWVPAVYFRQYYTSQLQCAADKAKLRVAVILVEPGSAMLTYHTSVVYLPNRL